MTFHYEILIFFSNFSIFSSWEDEDLAGDDDIYLEIGSALGDRTFTFDDVQHITPGYFPPFMPAWAGALSTNSASPTSVSQSRPGLIFSSATPVANGNNFMSKSKHDKRRLTAATLGEYFQISPRKVVFLVLLVYNHKANPLC